MVCFLLRRRVGAKGALAEEAGTLGSRFRFASVPERTGVLLPAQGDFDLGYMRRLFFKHAPRLRIFISPLACLAFAYALSLIIEAVTDIEIIDAEITGLAEQYERRGLQGLVEVVAERVRRELDGQRLVFLRVMAHAHARPQLDHAIERFKLADHGIGTEIYYPVPMHQQECFAYLKQADTCPNATLLASEALSIPVYAELPPSQRAQVMEVIRESVQ